MKNLSKRYRKFSCITYLNETQLNRCLNEHSNQIRVYAYAYHDKDVREDGTLKGPHYHVILITYCTCTLSAVRRWFSGYVQNGKDVTTTAQNCTDVFEMYDYLIHDTLQAKSDGKYQYDASIRVTNDEEYFKANDVSNFDNITLALCDLQNGVPLDDIAKRYGRDFIIHYGHLKTLFNDIQKQNGGMML